MRRLLVPADVPIHRPSVGAMALASGSTMQEHVLYVFKPYIYRGTGVDQLEPVLVVAPEPPKTKPKPKKRRPKKPPRWWSDRPRLNYRPELPSPPYAPRTYWTPKPAPPSVPLIPLPPIRPAAGWQPTSGADIDAMLNDLLGEDE